MTATRKPPKFYAIHWPYGRDSNSDGTRCGYYRAFASAVDRDEWVAERRTEYASQAGYREPISSRDHELRRELRLQGLSPQTCRLAESEA